MADKLDLIAEFRTDTGKGSSRRLRRAGKVPAINHGAGREPPPPTFKPNGPLKGIESQCVLSKPP